MKLPIERGFAQLVYAACRLVIPVSCVGGTCSNRESLRMKGPTQAAVRFTFPGIGLRRAVGAAGIRNNRRALAGLNLTGDTEHVTVGGRYFFSTVTSVEQASLCSYRSATVTVMEYFPREPDRAPELNSPTCGRRKVSE
jgi:hypothetical protein